ncbi:MAG: hypothetical protein NTX15_10800 [Candidatus Kapabacteria bacterium]|nr:hypothetical protein [Candidatus Kapabacteria bacterium]
MATQREPKLIQLLKPLSQVQMEAFVSFARSPYFNTSEILSRLVETLALLHPFDMIPSDEDIWQSIQPGATYRYATLRNWYSDVVALAMSFLAIERIRSQTDLLTTYQVSALRNMRVFPQFEKLLKSSLEDIRGRAVRDDATLELEWSMLEEKSLFETYVTPGTERSILQDELNVLVEMSIARLLRQLTLMVHEQYQHGVDFSLHLSMEIVEFLQRNPHFRKNACIDVNAAVLELSAAPSPNALATLRTLVKQRIHELPFVDGYMAFTHLADHCMHQINMEGDDRYYSEALVGIQTQIELKFLGKPNLLYPDYIFLVRMAVNAGEVRYARAFMADYAEALMPSVREHVMELCEAVIAQYEGRPLDALGSLQRVSINQPLFKLMVRVYTIENLIQLGRWDDVRTAVDALRHLGFKPGAISVRHAAMMEELVRIAPRIATVAETDNDARRADRVRQALEAINAMPNNVFGVRNWLRSYVESIS